MDYYQQFKAQCKEYQAYYTDRELALNEALYEACLEDELDTEKIEALLVAGADPLGPVSREDITDHIYEELIGESSFRDGKNLPAITALFLRHGMEVSRPRIPYDGSNSIHPLWAFTFVPSPNGAAALKLLLDRGLDADSAAEFWDHSLMDAIYVDQMDPNETLEWSTWTMKMIMLVASYSHVLEPDAELRDFIQLDQNAYDIQKFRNYDNYLYEFDTSRCEGFAQLRGTLIRIREAASGREVWHIGVHLPANS